MVFNLSVHALQVCSEAIQKIYGSQRRFAARDDDSAGFKNPTQIIAAACEADAIINAKPLGTFKGTREIDDFWRPFMSSGAGELKYSDVKLEAADSSTVLLSASWSMNVGRGIITKQKWALQNDGRWLLKEDDFEIQGNFETI